MKKLLLAEGKKAHQLGAALALLAGLGAGPAWAQVSTPLGTDINAPTIVRPDTATVRKVSKKQKSEQAAEDSARRTARLFGRRVTPAEKAGILAIVPGAGQIYNQKYWKLPLVYGMVGGLGYWVVYQQRYFSYFDYASSLQPLPQRLPSGANGFITVATQIRRSTSQISNDDIRLAIAQGDSINPNNYLASGLRVYRRYRDLSILVSGLGYGLQILDAVVDAHLSEFDVSDDLSLRWQPAAVPVPGQAAFVPGVVFTLRRRD